MCKLYYDDIISFIFDEFEIFEKTVYGTSYIGMRALNARELDIKPFYNVRESNTQYAIKDGKLYFGDEECWWQKYTLEHPYAGIHILDFPDDKSALLYREFLDRGY